MSIKDQFVRKAPEEGSTFIDIQIQAEGEAAEVAGLSVLASSAASEVFEASEALSIQLRCLSRTALPEMATCGSRSRGS